MAEVGDPREVGMEEVEGEEAVHQEAHQMEGTQYPLDQTYLLTYDPSPAPQT